MHRDKPIAAMAKHAKNIMFPVCTGINRITRVINYGLENVPCMHRDKPIRGSYPRKDKECSLYAQG